MTTARIELCRDGSHTLYSDTFGQFYHNPNGAVAESLHVFFETSGILSDLQENKPVNVLEIGFGTGLNALLLADALLQLNSSSTVTFQSVEAFPIGIDTAKNLNYSEFLVNPWLGNHLLPVFRQLQTESASYEFPGILQLDVFRGTVKDAQFKSRFFNYVFHDPFSPEVNPELWTATLFEKLKAACTPQSVLTTYCAATKARAAMVVGGWHAARAPGALGKREMTVASLDPEKLSGFSRLNEDRLRERFASQQR